MRDYKNYEIWKQAHALNLNVYKATRCFPDSEKFGLTSQIRRSTVSISLNIVEGSGRKSDEEFSRFLSIAASSAGETEYLIQLCHELDLFNRDTFEQLYDNTNHLRRMLYNFIKSLKKKLAFIRKLQSVWRLALSV